MLPEKIVEIVTGAELTMKYFPAAGSTVTTATLFQPASWLASRSVVGEPTCKVPLTPICATRLAEGVVAPVEV